MPRLILICGLICTGKSTYAESLCRSLPAINLSVDDLMLHMFGQDAGDMHDTYTGRAKVYLREQTLRLLRGNVHVVLDWGFWIRKEREETLEYFRGRGFSPELHFLDISQEEWTRRIRKRNADILAGQTGAYLVDEGLQQKALALFERPAPDEEDDLVPV